MRTCKRCFEIYQDSAILRGIWITDKSAFEPTEALVNAGKQLVRQTVPVGADHKNVLPSDMRSLFERYRRVGLAAACAVALLVVGMWWIVPGTLDRTRDIGISATVIAPVRTAVETVSMRGPFVLPGGEGSLDAAGAVYRSGFVPLTDSLEASLKYLNETFRRGGTSPDLACWLVGGYIATGQIDAARDLASSARRQHPEDPRIASLSALVAYMDGDYTRSEALLREALETESDNAAAGINLAVVLDELGKEAEAREILTRIRQDHPGTPLAERAQSILVRIPEE